MEADHDREKGSQASRGTRGNTGSQGVPNLGRVLPGVRETSRTSNNQREPRGVRAIIANSTSKYGTFPTIRGAIGPALIAAKRAGWTHKILVNDRSLTLFRQHESLWEVLTVAAASEVSTHLRVWYQTEDTHLVATLPITASEISGVLGFKDGSKKKPALFTRRTAGIITMEADHDREKGSQASSHSTRSSDGIHRRVLEVGRISTPRDCYTRGAGGHHIAASSQPYAAQGTLKVLLERAKAIGYTHHQVSLPVVILFKNIHGLWHQVTFKSSYPTLVDGSLAWALQCSLTTCEHGELPSQAKPIVGYLGIRASLFQHTGIITMESDHDRAGKESSQASRHTGNSDNQRSCGVRGLDRSTSGRVCPDRVRGSRTYEAGRAASSVGESLFYRGLCVGLVRALGASKNGWGEFFVENYVTNTFWIRTNSGLYLKLRKGDFPLWMVVSLTKLDIPPVGTWSPLKNLCQALKVSRKIASLFQRRGYHYYGG